MLGQIDLFGNVEGVKKLHYYMGLSSCFTKCPYCGCINPESGKLGNICENCKKVFDSDNCIIHKTKDFEECEKLNLHGPVRKNDKGFWEEVKI